MARGVQNKLLEALAMGLPCVASTAAWRGTVVAEEEGILVSDDPGEFARHVVDLLQDSTRRAEMARRARVAAEANYRWEAQLARFDQVIAAVLQPLPQRNPVSSGPTAFRFATARAAGPRSPLGF